MVVYATWIWVTVMLTKMTPIRASRKVKPFERILEESGYIAAGEYTEKSDYLSVNATSSYLPTRYI